MKYSKKYGKNYDLKTKYYEEIPNDHNDPLIDFLHKTIRIAVKILAVLMVFVIIWGIGDVVYVLYMRLMLPPVFLLSISDILPIKLVVATALMAISRKVIIFDFKEITPMFIIATASVVLALSISYWLISKKV